MSHTLGPWHKAEANATIPIKAANGRTVASVRYGEDDDANATLIATAPKLLAALKLAESMLESSRSPSPEYMEVIHNVIVEAGGYRP